LVTKRSLVTGIMYIVVIEGVLANLPFGIRLMTVIYYTRLITFRTLEFVIPTPHGAHNIAAEAWQFDVAKDPGLLEHPQLATSLIVLIVASLLCTVLAAFIFTRREFHVKTPEI
jgi:ABC-2 type transport system permease protein